MITTAVQPASEVVGIQSAPPALPLFGDAFRTTFAASVSDSAAVHVKSASSTVKSSAVTGAVSQADSRKQELSGESVASGMAPGGAGAKQGLARSMATSNKISSGVACTPTSSNPALEATALQASSVTAAPPDLKVPAPVIDLTSTAVSFNGKQSDLRTEDSGVNLALVKPASSAVPSLSSTEAKKQEGNASVRKRQEVASGAGTDAAAGLALAIEQRTAPWNLSGRVKLLGLAEGPAGDTQAHPDAQLFAQMPMRPDSARSTTGQGSSLPTDSSSSSSGASLLIAPGLSVEGVTVAAVSSNNPYVGAVSRPTPMTAGFAATRRLGTPGELNGAQLYGSSVSSSGADTTGTPARNVGNVTSVASDRAPATGQPGGRGKASLPPEIAPENEAGLAEAASSVNRSVVFVRSDTAGRDTAVKPEASPTRSLVASAVGEDYSQPAGVFDSSRMSPVLDAKAIAAQHQQRVTHSTVLFAPAPPEAADAASKVTSSSNAENSVGSGAAAAVSGAQSLTTSLPSAEIRHESASASMLPSITQADPASVALSLDRSANATGKLEDSKGKPHAGGKAEDAVGMQTEPAQGLAGGAWTNSASVALPAAKSVPEGAAMPTGVPTPPTYATTAQGVALSFHPTGVTVPSGAVTHPSSGAVPSSIADFTAATSPVAESHRTLLATPTALEVGVQSGAQGWLRIRAEVGGQGEVSTSLAAASISGREMLHGQLPALTAFLHSEQIAATTAVVDRMPSTTTGPQGGTAMGSGGMGSQNGTGGSNGSVLQGGGAQGDRSPRNGQQPSSAIESVSSYDARIGISDFAGLGSGRTAIFEESGRWLNIRV